ncbi:unnamed protein product [Symbiodinium sp. CCMP2592]|nr:unnamed protein product [Symbiodinium sp. CCMP2592]
MAGYGVSLHGLGRVCGGQAESPQTEKDVDPANFQQLLRQLRDQSVMQGDVAALRQEMLTLKMVVSTAKTEMTVLIEQEVGEAIAKERAERERAERLMDERVAANVQQSQIQQEEVEKLQGRLESTAKAVQATLEKLTKEATEAARDGQVLQHKLQRLEDKEGRDMTQIKQDMNLQTQSLQATKVQLEHLVQETCQQFQAEQGQELLEVNSKYDTLHKAIWGRLAVQSRQMKETTHLGLWEDLNQLAGQVQDLVSKQEGSAKLGEEQGRLLDELQHSHDGLEKRTSELMDRLAAAEQKHALLEESSSQGDTKVLQLSDKMTQMAQVSEKLLHDAQAAAIASAAAGSQVHALETWQAEAQLKLGSLERAAAEVRETCSQAVQLKAHTQEQERWHDRFADCLQRLASLETQAVSIGQDRKACDEDLRRIQAQSRILETSLEQAAQADARQAELQSRLEERCGAMDLRQSSMSEELARMLSKEKIIEDLDAKVCDLQPCIASCDENLALIRNLQAAHEDIRSAQEGNRQSLDTSVRALEQQFSEVQRSNSEAKDSLAKAHAEILRLSRQDDALSSAQATLSHEVDLIQKTLPTVVENQKEIYATGSVLKRLEDQVNALPKAQAELHDRARALAESRYKELGCHLDAAEKRWEDRLKVAQSSWAAEKASTESQFVATRQRLDKVDAGSKEVQLAQVAAAKDLQVEFESLRGRLGAAEQQQDLESKQLAGRIVAAQAAAESNLAVVRQLVDKTEASTESQFVAIRQRLDKVDADSKEVQLAQVAAAKDLQVEFESLRGRLGAAEQQQAFSNSGISAVRQQIDKLHTESAEALKILEVQLSEQFSGQMSAVELKQAAAAAELRKALDAELAGAQAALRERLSEVLEQLPELEARLEDQKGQIEAVRTRQDVNYDAVESLQASHARAAQEASKISSRVEQLVGMMTEEQRIREAETTQAKQGIRELEATQANLTTQLEDFGGVLETVRRSVSDVDDMLTKRLGDVSKRLETVQAVQAEQRTEAEEHKADLQRLHDGLHNSTILAERHRAEDLQRLTIPLEEQMHGFTWTDTSQEEKEACVVRLFQRFPDVLLHLGDPQLAQRFELPRQSVKLKQQPTENRLTVELKRRLQSTSVTAAAQGVAQALDAMTASLTSLAQSPPSHGQMAPVQPMQPRDLAFGQSQSFFSSNLARQAHTSGSRSFVKPRHELLKEDSHSSSSPSFGRAAATKGFAKAKSLPARGQSPPGDGAEVWLPGQSSDEEPSNPAPPAHGKSNSSTSKRDASPTSSDPSFESPFFPVALQRDATGTTEASDAGSTSAGLDIKSLRSPAASAAGRLTGDLMAHARGLGARRGLALQLSSKSSRSSIVVPPMDDDGRSTPPSSSSRMAVGMRIPDSEEPAVQLVFQTEPPKRRTSRCNTIPADMMLAVAPRILQVAKVPRPLPAAFPIRRNIIFFDWDDTLCPTSWIRSLLKEHLADMEEWLDQYDDCLETEEDWRDSIPSWFKQPLPDEPHVRQLIADLQTACIRTIRIAQSLGVVCIVTNAVPGWVEKTIKRWLPKLRTHIGVHGVHSVRSQHPIKVIYAQQAYCDGSKNQNLPFVDEQGEFMLWKKAAMAGALTELDHLYGLEEKNEAKVPGLLNVVNVVSIGDTEAEMSAAELASQGLHSQHPKRGRLYRRACGLQDQPEPGGNQSEKPCGSRTSSKDGSKEDASGSSGSESGQGASGLERSERDRDCDFGEFGPGRSRSLETSNRRAFGAFRPWVKLIKLSEGCQARRLTAQLEEIAQLLPKMLALRRDVRVDLTEGASKSQFWQKALGCTEEDLRLERHLCVETL